MTQIVLGPNKAYPSIPSVSGDLENHTLVLQALREAVEIHERRTRNTGDSFVRVNELEDLGLLNVDPGTGIIEAEDDDGSYIRRDGTSAAATGRIDFGAGIDVAGVTQLEELTASGAVTFSSTLAVEGEATFDGDIEFGPAGFQVFNLRNASRFNFFNAGSTAFVGMQHDGANFVITGIAGDTFDISAFDRTRFFIPLNLRDNVALQFGNGLDVAFSYDATDFNSVFANTTDWNITGLTGTVVFANGATTSGDNIVEFGSRVTIRGDGVLSWGPAADYGLLTWDTDRAAVAAYSGNTLSLGANGRSQDMLFTLAGEIQSLVDFAVRTGNSFSILDSTNADSVTFSHDGTNLTTAFVGTTRWNVDSVTSIDLRTGTDLRIRDAGVLTIFDSTDTDSATFSHDGTDFNTTFVNTTDWNVGNGLSAIRYYSGLLNAVFSFGRSIDQALTMTLDDATLNMVYTQDETDTTAHQWLFDIVSSNTGSRNFQFRDNGVTKFIINHFADQIDIRDGYTLVIRDAADTDSAAFSHDGIDFNTVFVNTVDWNVSGLTSFEITGQAANWDTTTPGTTHGTVHLIPNATTDFFGNAITFAASDVQTTAQAGIYIRSDGSFGTAMYLATTDSYVTGSKTAIAIDHSGNVEMPRGQLTIAKQSGPHITLKDSNNTGVLSEMWIEFIDSANTRRSFIGHGTTADDNLYIYSDNDDVRLRAGDNLTFYTGGNNFRGQFTSTGNFRLASGTDIEWAGATQPWLTLDSTSSGDNWSAQGAGISVGESGKKGGAAIHMTYNGNGSGFLGMGAVDDTATTGGRPAFSHIEFSYNNFQVQIGGLLYPGTITGGTQTSRYIRDVTGQFGSIQVEGTVNGWSGYSIGARHVLMDNGSTSVGLYNDTNNEWMIFCVDNAEVRLYNNGVSVAQTLAAASGGLQVNNTLTGTGFERVLTTSDLGGGSVMRGVLDNDLTRTSTIALANINNMQFSLAATTVYKIRFVGFLTNPVTGTNPGGRFRLDYTGSVTTSNGRTREYANSGLIRSTRMNADSTVIGYDCGSAVDPTIVVYEAYIETGTAGTLTMQFGQSVSSANSSNLARGASIEVVPE